MSDYNGGKQSGSQAQNTRFSGLGMAYSKSGYYDF